MEKEKIVRKIANQYQLDEKAIVYLDSIAWQMQEVGRYLKTDLEDIAKIAQGHEEPYKALQLIDKSLPEYLARLSARKAGSFKELLEKEEKVKTKIGRLTIKGLEARIEEHLLRIDPPAANYVGRVATQDDISPYQENAIRALEGD